MSAVSTTPTDFPENPLWNRAATVSSYFVVVLQRRLYENDVNRSVLVIIHVAATIPLKHLYMKFSYSRNLISLNREAGPGPSMSSAVPRLMPTQSFLHDYLINVCKFSAASQKHYFQSVIHCSCSPLLLVTANETQNLLQIVHIKNPSLPSPL